MVQGPQQINILLLLSFVSGFVSMSRYIYIPVFGLLTYFLPQILQSLKLFNIEQYDQKQIIKIRLTMFLFGLVDSYCLKHMNLFSIYLIVLSIYHVGQFQLINLYHHSSLSWSSFLLYHSREYSIANAFCMLQHVVTKSLFNFGYKTDNPVSIIGFIFMISGLVMRLVSFYTAKSNFTHLVQHDKRSNHKLVTHGIYKYVRHPGYLGYFMFSLGSMVFIGNFICFVIYFIVLSRFFKDRIQYQEETLVYFFDEYEEYRRKTPTYLPFVSSPEDKKYQYFPYSK